MANSQLPTMNYELRTTSYANRLNTPNSTLGLSAFVAMRHEIPSIILFLCALVPLWLCLLSFTFVKNPLQISSFMQNKPNFGKAQMNVNKVLTRDYENIANCKLRKNKPKQSQYKPKQSQFAG